MHIRIEVLAARVTTAVFERFFPKSRMGLPGLGGIDSSLIHSNPSNDGCERLKSLYYLSLVGHAAVNSSEAKKHSIEVVD